MGIELLAILGGFGLLGLLVMDLTLERQDTPWLFVCAIALAREVLHNPNWALDAALKLGAESPYALMPPAYEYWLAKRAETVPELMPSTQRGID